MTTHTEEPWFLPEGSTCIHNSDGEVPRSSANERRKVACVNACKGLSTDDLEKNGLVSAVGYQLIESDKERDQLRELCGELKNSLRALYWNDCTKHSKAIEDLIAKAEKILGETE